MRHLFVLFTFVIFLSCAPKVCPDPSEVLQKVLKPPPENITLYGYVKAPFFRTPFLLEKKGNVEKVRVGKEGVFLSTEFLCVGLSCFELPVSPVEIIFGYFPGKYTVEACDGEEVVLVSDGKVLKIKGNKVKEIKLGDLKLFYGKRTDVGYYENITILFGDVKLKLYIEGMQWEKEG